VPGLDRWWKIQRLALKYRLMRMERLIYPDVYCLARYFGDKFDFVQEGREIQAGEYDLVLSELQESASQLEYLESLVLAGDPPVAVVPGPPEILLRNPTPRKLDSVRRILSTARHVWAYSHNIAQFVDQLIGKQRAVVIPWPFDFRSVACFNLAHLDSKRPKQVLFQVPLRFCGVTQNSPFLLKSIVQDVWSELPKDVQASITLHTFTYSSEDHIKCNSSGFLKGLPLKVEPKMRYISFLKFLGESDAVVNLTAGSILGRITFLSAALGKPGIFSSNSELNQKLYPSSTVSLLDTDKVHDLLRKLLLGVVGLEAPSLLPSMKSAAEIGNFERNAVRMQAILKGTQSCAGSPVC